MRKIFAFHAFRFFSPILPFITPYFVEVKKIPVSKFHSEIVPYFFISSFLTMLIGPFFVELLGEKLILIVETLLEIIFLCCFNFIPTGNTPEENKEKEEDNLHEKTLQGQKKETLESQDVQSNGNENQPEAPENQNLNSSAQSKGIFYLIIITCFHGASTSLGMLTKKMLYAEGGDRPAINSTFNIIKRTSAILSGLVGQDLFFSSGMYSPSLILSILTSAIASGISFFLVSPVPVHQERSGIDLFTSQHIFFSLLYIIASTVYIALTVYSASIFIERRKNRNMSTNLFGKFLFYCLSPLRLFSFIFLKGISLFTKTNFSSKYDNEKLIFGYIDAIARIISIIFAYLITQKSYTLHSGSIVLVILIIPTIFITFLLGKAKNLFSTYLSFIFAFTCANSALILAQSGISQVKRMSVCIGINLAVANFIHMTINKFCKMRSLAAHQKMKMYLISSLTLYLPAVIYWFWIGCFKNQD